MRPEAHNPHDAAKNKTSRPLLHAYVLVLGTGTGTGKYRITGIFCDTGTGISRIPVQNTRTNLPQTAQICRLAAVCSIQGDLRLEVITFIFCDMHFKGQSLLSALHVLLCT